MIYFNKDIKYDNITGFFNQYNLYVSIDYGKGDNIGIKPNDSNEGIASDFCITD